MEKEKSKKVLTVVMVLVAIISVIGAAYAGWRYLFVGDVNILSTPSVELELLESTDEIINIENALPKSDDQGKSQSETFNFAVTTRTAGQSDHSLCKRQRNRFD